MTRFIRFRFLSGDADYATYGGKWISNRQNSGEFDYYFVIELMNWEEVVGEREAQEVGATYNVSLSVVSPQEAGESNLHQAYDCCGIEPDMLARAEENGYLAEMQVEALHGYGLYTPVFDANGNNWRKLMRQARQEAHNCEMLFGFYMDKPVNRIGETGWERLRGANPREVLDRVLQK